MYRLSFKVLNAIIFFLIKKYPIHYCYFWEKLWQIWGKFIKPFHQLSKEDKRKCNLSFIQECLRDSTLQIAPSVFSLTESNLNDYLFFTLTWWISQLIIGEGDFKSKNTPKYSHSKNPVWVFFNISRAISHMFNKENKEEKVEHDSKLIKLRHTLFILVEDNFLWERSP